MGAAFDESIVLMLMGPFDRWGSSGDLQARNAGPFPPGV